MSHVLPTGEGAGRSRRPPAGKIRIRSHRRYWRRWPAKKPGRPASSEKRDVIRRMALEALNEDDKGKTLLLDDLL